MLPTSPRKGGRDYALRSNASLGRAKGEHILRVKQASKHPTMRDLAWAAGFLEGEGNFGVNNRKLKGGWASNVVRATQKQLEPLYRLQAIFGGTVTTARSDGYGEWRTYGARARGIMFTLFTFMSPNKRADIQRSIEVTCGAN